MNCVHVPLQIFSLIEELPTRDALVRLLPEVDSLVVALHVTKLAEDFDARGLGAGKLHTQVHLAVVTHHDPLVREQLDTGGIGAWNLATRRPLLVANIARCTLLLLETALKVSIEEMLR